MDEELGPAVSEAGVAGCKTAPSLDHSLDSSRTISSRCFGKSVVDGFCQQPCLSGDEDAPRELYNRHEYPGIIVRHANIRLPASALEENAPEGHRRLERTHLR